MKRMMVVGAFTVGMAANAASVSTAQQAVTVQVSGPSGSAIQAPEVPFVPTPEAAVDGMLALAGVKPGDTVYDLGSGDGRIVISAVRKHGAKHAVGVDINPERIAEANQNASQAGVKNKVEFRQGDLFDADISGASVVTLYLLPSVNERLKSKLLTELKPGTRIVSHSFDMGDWAPTKTVQSEGRTLYLLPSVNERLKSKLLTELKPGTRIVSHSFDMGDWAPTKTVQSEGRTLYLWVVPERGTGTGGAPR